ENSEEWIAAMNDEMASLKKNETWHLVERPIGANIVKNRWVYRIKENSDGSVARFKARLVAKGFTQKKGIDFQETFAPVVKMTSVRTILAIAAHEDMELVQFDVKTAFLHGELEEEIFMEQPIGYNDNSGRVCRLQKSLYGLKQAPRCWNEKFHSFLKQFGLNRSKADNCVYISNNCGAKTILGLYVDDGLLASTSKEFVTKMIKFLEQHFDMEVRNIDCFLGLQIIRERKLKLLKVHQETFIRKILTRFAMNECKPVKCPSDVGTKLVKSENFDGSFPYRELIGSLMYAMLGTRPDIAFAVSKLAQFLDCSNE
ncbi:integrase core domain protein-like protein, partial [Leptotrombidium deliense]